MELSQRKSFLRSNTLPEKQAACLSTKLVTKEEVILSKDANPFEIVLEPNVEISSPEEEIVTR